MKKNRLEEVFLAGPNSRWLELKFVLTVLIEFIKGLRSLHFIGPAVTIFGSARFDEKNPWYIKAMEMGEGVANLGFTVLTGGGPGIMEAANRGAKNVGGKSMGCNIVLPMEQEPNPYLDKWVDIKYFFVRKTLLIKYSYAFIIMPGGFGTLDEFFETITLIQTKKLYNFPVVIFDKEFHQRILDHFEHMKLMGTISTIDSNMYLVTDDVNEALKYIKDNTIEHFKAHPNLTPSLLLGERS